MQSSFQSHTSYCCVACNVAFNNFEEQKLHYFTYHSRSIDQSLFTSNLYSSYQQLSSNIKKPLLIKCEICSISCTSQLGYDIHMKGKRHTKALNKIALTENDSIIRNNSVAEKESKPGKKLPNVPIIQQSQISYNPNLTCDVCQVSCSKLDQLQKHLEGNKHQRKMKLNRFLELKSKNDPSVYCDICDIYLQEELMSKHIQCSKHKRKSTPKTLDEPAQKKMKVGSSSSVKYCGYCQISLKSPNDAMAHYQSQKHAVNLVNRSKTNDLWCEACQISFDNQSCHDLHLNGFRHYVRVNRGNDHPEGELSSRLLKMREKMKNLKLQKRVKKFNYFDKYKFVPNEPPPPQVEKDGAGATEDVGNSENEILLSNGETSVVTQNTE